MCGTPHVHQLNLSVPLNLLWDPLLSQFCDVEPNWRPAAVGLILCCLIVCNWVHGATFCTAGIWSSLALTHVLYQNLQQRLEASVRLIWNRSTRPALFRTQAGWQIGSHIQSPITDSIFLRNQVEFNTVICKWSYMFEVVFNFYSPSLQSKARALGTSLHFAG